MKYLNFPYFSRLLEPYSKTANAEYRNKVDKWEEQYGEKVQNKEESISKRLRNYQRENADRQTKQISKSRNRGAR